jgi:hypothetical protein
MKITSTLGYSTQQNYHSREMEQSKSSMILKQYMTTKPPLQKILQGILHTENESKQTHKRAGNTKPQEKKRQESRE